MNDPTDETDRRLARLFASRDPGDAPAGLRDRVAAVPDAAGRRPGWLERAFLPFRPAVAVLGAAAAVLAGFLVLATLRGSPVVGPAGPGNSTPGVDLATVGTPLGLSIGWVVLMPLFALLAGWVAVEVCLRTPSAVGIELGRLRRKRARAVFVLVLATPVLVLGQVVQYDTSLTPGAFFQASHVHLEGMGTMSSATTLRDEPVAYFRYVPGGTVTFVQSVRNAGRFPITVTGGTARSPGLELRLFAVHDPTGPIDVDTMPTYPLAPFQLAPGAEREVVVVAHFGPCPGVPLPSTEPSPNLSGDYSPPPRDAAAYEEIGTLGLAYSVLGFARETDVPLFATVVAVSPTDQVCGMDPAWASPSPTLP